MSDEERVTGYTADEAINEAFDSLEKELTITKEALRLACEIIHSTKCNILFKEECSKIASVQASDVKSACAKCRQEHFIKEAEAATPSK